MICKRNFALFFKEKMSHFLTSNIDPTYLFQDTRAKIDWILFSKKFLASEASEKMSKIKQLLLKFSKEALEKLRECIRSLRLHTNPIYKTFVMVNIDNRIDAL
jgi:hypothetical protein